MADEEDTGPGVVGTLNVKSAGCDLEPGKKEETALCHVYGFVNGTRAGVNPRNGDAYEVLTGDFEAVNLQDGVVTRSGKLFLPSGIHETLLAPFHSENPPERIKFGFTIYNFPASNMTGYSYKAVPFEKPGESDPLNELRERSIKLLKPSTKQIAAPAATKKK